MANIKSQKKRIITSENARIANKSKKSRIATEIKKFREQIEAKDFDTANQTLRLIVSLIDRARLDGVYQTNTASRKKANLARQLYKAQQVNA